MHSLEVLIFLLPLVKRQNYTLKFGNFTIWGFWTKGLGVNFKKES